MVLHFISGIPFFSVFRYDDNKMVEVETTDECHHMQGVPEDIINDGGDGGGDGGGGLIGKMIGSLF